MIDYNKRLVEVDEILNYLSKEDLMKIPEEIRLAIKDNKDKEYLWKYDETKPLKDQDVSRDTIAFLSYLNMEYLLNEEQKDFMHQLHEFNERKLEEEKSKKYNPDDLFKNKHFEEKEIQNVEGQSLVVYEDNIFKKIFNKVKNFFRSLIK